MRDLCNTDAARVSSDKQTSFEMLRTQFMQDEKELHAHKFIQFFENENLRKTKDFYNYKMKYRAPDYN